MKRAGQVWIRVYPDVPVSKKPLEVRMGSGKGSVELWVCRVKPGRILFEVDGISVELAKEALTLAAAKLPIKTRFRVAHRRLSSRTKAMKASDARTMTVDQLDDEVLKLKKEQFNLRFQRATGQLENTSRVREVRRDIARMLTIAKQKRAGDCAGGASLPSASARPSVPAVKRTAKPRPPVSNRTEAAPGVPGQGEEEVRGSPCRSERSRAWWSATSRTRP